MGYVTVKVEGDNKDQVKLVAAGIVTGLENTGFKDVKLAVEHEIHNVDEMLNIDRSLDAPSTLLASIRMRSPELFEETVVVQVPVVKPDGKGVRALMTPDDHGRLNTILEENDPVPTGDRQSPFRTETHAALDRVEDADEVIGVLEHGLKHPFDDRKVDVTLARATALGILADLTDRSGIGNELDCLDDDLKRAITTRMERIIETSMNRVELYNAVERLVKDGTMSQERASSFLHAMNRIDPRAQ